MRAHTAVEASSDAPENLEAEMRMRPPPRHSRVVWPGRMTGCICTGASS